MIIDQFDMKATNHSEATIFTHFIYCSKTITNTEISYKLFSVNKVVLNVKVTGQT